MTNITNDSTSPELYDTEESAATRAIVLKIVAALDAAKGDLPSARPDATADGASRSRFLASLEVWLKQNCRLCLGHVLASSESAHDPALRPVGERRRRFLLRMLVARFSHLFATGADGDIDRSLVYGLDIYLRKFLGENRYDEMNAEAHRCLARFPDCDDAELWRSVMADAKGRTCLLNLVVGIVLKFETYARSRATFVTIVNNGQMRWVPEFTSEQFDRLFALLSSDLFAMAHSDGDAAELDALLGGGTAAALRRTERAFRQDVRFHRPPPGS